MNRNLIDKSDGELLLQQHSEWSYKAFIVKYPRKSESDYHKFMNEIDRQHGSKELQRAGLKGLGHFTLLTPSTNYADFTTFSELKSYGSYSVVDFGGMVDAIISTPSFTKEVLLHLLVFFAQEGSYSNLQNFKKLSLTHKRQYRESVLAVLEEVNKKTDEKSEVNEERLTRIFPHVFSEILHYHGEEKRKFGIDIPSRFCFMFGNRCIKTHISRGYIERSVGDILFENHYKWCNKLLQFVFSEYGSKVSELECLACYLSMDKLCQSPELSWASQKAAAHFGLLEVEYFVE